MRSPTAYHALLALSLAPATEGFSLARSQCRSAVNRRRFCRLAELPPSTALASAVDVNSELSPGGAFSLAVPVVCLLALGLGIASQGWINRMVEGEDGLGAFLQDGKDGYSGSKFKLQERAVSEDPLPWLKLPELDFVDVAGQDPGSDAAFEDNLNDRFESLRQQMNESIDRGDMEMASEVRAELEKMMSEFNVNFTND